MDSHADSTCAAGPHFHRDEYTGKNDVITDSTDYEPIKSVSYTKETTGETMILRFNQVLLWFGKKMNTSLLNHNQIRYCV